MSDWTRPRPGRTARLMGRIALPIVAQLEQGGADVERVLAAAGLKRAQLEDPDVRIDHERWVALLEIGARATGDPCFGLHAAEQLSRRSYSLPALFIQAQPTLGEGLRRLDRYFHIVHEGMQLALLLDGDRARVRLDFLPGLAQPRILAEHMIAFGSVLGVQLFGAECPRPREVRFAHAPPASTAEHERVIRGPVRFGTEHTEIAFDTATLSLPLDSANPHLGAILEDEARRLAERLPSGATLVGRCAAWVRSQVHAGREPRITDMAAELALGERTLRRRLESEGTSVRALVDEVRREMASAHVASGRLSLDEIALLLGFSEAAAFRRAFRRWTGQSPSQFRRRHGA
ncbi:MAG: AraC family transcriptional regulator ligand-binding domain-containing protein [Deltaproteobacteria bacterium]|nr:AraC family transcriptional regulator ligand-binding domain-containing protein [Deltaproteobacteria bacterium]